MKHWGLTNKITKETTIKKLPNVKYETPAGNSSGLNILN